jgi:phosphatidylinositol alpha-1,6-mannosyltransferase
MNPKSPAHVILYEFLPPSDGGIAQMAWGMAHELHRRGLRVALCGFRGLLRDPMYRGSPLLLFGLPRFGWKHFKDLYCLALAVRLFACFGRRVVLYSLTWKTGRVFAAMAKLLGWKLVLFAIGNEVTRQMGGKKEGIMRRTFAAADAVVSLSGYTASRLAPLGIRDSFVNNPGIDPALFRPLDTGACKKKFGWEGRQIVLTAARVVARKGQDVVVQALAALAAEFPECRYVIAGGGAEQEMARLRELAAENKVADRVVFTGYVQEADKVALYNACDVYVMVSRHEQEEKDIEGFGITFLEAGGCGKPVIGGRSGGIPDAIEDGVSGFLVDPSDHAAVANCLKRLLADAALRQRMGSAGRSRVEQLFTWEKYATRMLAHLAQRGIIRLA